MEDLVAEHLQKLDDLEYRNHIAMSALQPSLFEDERKKIILPPNRLLPHLYKMNNYLLQIKKRL
jgi:hypothetical protein